MEGGLSSSVDDFYVKYATAIYQSQAFNIGTAITAWSTFDVSNTLGGAGGITYALYSDSDASITITNSATFTSSQTITSGGIPSFAVAPYLTFTGTYNRNVSTDTAALNSTTQNYIEGSITRHWGAVDKDHRIIWSVAEGTATVPNVSYIYDPRVTNGSPWLKYSFPMEAPARVGDSLYFGGVSTGVVYAWPSGNTDNGSAITAYWKTKDFVGNDPFSEKFYKNISLITKTQTGSNLDVTYTVNTSTAVSYNISLTDSDGNTLRRSNTKIQSGKRGTFFNVKLGNDDSDSPFEILGIRFDYEDLPWRILQ